MTLPEFLDHLRSTLGDEGIGAVAVTVRLTADGLLTHADRCAVVLEFIVPVDNGCALAGCEGRDIGETQH